MTEEQIYGDPNNIAIFETENPNSRVTKTNKIFCNEPYRDELMQIYDDYEKGRINYDNFDLDKGDVVGGVISHVTEEDIILDVGAKDFLYIPLSKESNVERLELGKEVSCLVTSKKGGVIKGSISEYAKTKLHLELKDPENDKVYDAKVMCLSDNGYILNIDGLDVFMPGSLGGINKLVDFNALLGKTIKVVPIKNDNKYSKFKSQLIVSHRDYLKTLIPEEAEKLEVGNTYYGKVTDTAKFGVFIEFGVDENSPSVLTGLIHKDDFDKGLKDVYDSRELVAGTEVEFYLKEVVHNTRIILSRLPLDEDTLKSASFVIKKGDIVEGKVTKVVKYGAFVLLPNRKSGLIHINKLKNVTDLESGDEINVRVLDIQGTKYDLTLA